jgi:hypothetical protein
LDSHDSHSCRTQDQGDACGEATTTDGDQDNIRSKRQKLEGDCPLSRDDVRIIKGVEKTAPKNTGLRPCNRQALLEIDAGL